jgi:hypothetical protein
MATSFLVVELDAVNEIAGKSVKTVTIPIVIFFISLS